MKGLLTPRQLSTIKQDRYDLYEVLVAKHMWHIIRRRLPKARGREMQCIQETKLCIEIVYGVDWKNRCLLCDLYRTGDKCGDCILGDCKEYSPYREASYGSRLACDEIIEAIEQDAHKRGVYANGIV